jgi:glutamate-1-semialdehyde 2,1-aminomutase
MMERLAVPKITSRWDANRHPLRQSDIELFQRHLMDWMPADAVDIHAHVFAGPPRMSLDRLRSRQKAWMATRAPAGGLISAMPARHLDVNAANDFVLSETDDAWRGLMVIRPSDDPAAVERRVREEGWLGFTEAAPDEHLPDWAWEMAHRHHLILMVHIVRNAVPCQEFPNARLLLAHAAGALSGRHAVDSVGNLPLVDNIFFDTSAVCEPHAFQAILRRFGSERLLFGTGFPISEARGSSRRHGSPTLTGIESLLALRVASELSDLRDSDLERIFRRNAHWLIGRQAIARESGAELYAEAVKLIPGGTQLLSKRPELQAPGEWPAYYREAHGCEVIDSDRRHYYDFLHNGVGACLLGYAHPEVTAAVIRRIRQGSMCTLNNPEEVELARALLELHPWAQRVRYGRSGGEALAIAVRIARASTGRDVVLVCGYHGWSDWYLAANLADDQALDGHLLPGLSPCGVPRGLRGTALPFPYNDAATFRALMNDQRANVAAVVMEPTRHEPPVPGFLAEVREACDDCGAKLIFDEVTSGFRLHRGGAHLLYGVAPDIAVFAKALGNGHPIAAIVGTASAMQAAEKSFISSTYWTEGCGPAAALATLEVMKRVEIPRHLARIGERFRQGCLSAARRYDLPLRINGHAALNYLSFEHPHGQALMTLFTVRMLIRGFLAGSCFYPTLAHKDAHVDAFLQAVDGVFAELAESIRKQDTIARIGGRVRQTGFARLTGSSR